jgi:opacity protein-like surface antigen
MDFKVTNRHLFLLVIMGLLSWQKTSFSQNVQIIYGPKQGLTFRTNSQNMHFVLILGSFTQKKNATNYQRLLKEKTNEDIRLEYRPQLKNTPWVVIKTVYGVAALHKICALITAPFPSSAPVKRKRASYTKNQVATDRTINDFKTKEMPPKPNRSKYSYFATAAGGNTWLSKGKVETFYVGPGIERAYVPRGINTPKTMEFFSGINYELIAHLKSQLGLTVAMSNAIKLNGNIWDDALSQFNNYHYSYDIKHFHIGIKNKLSKRLNQGLNSYISAGLALAYNNAKNFQNTPTISEAVTQPNFQSNTTKSLSYSFGAGLTKELRKHWSIGVGYEFSDWGRAQLLKASGQSLASGLAISHLYANSLQISLDYSS